MTRPSYRSLHSSFGAGLLALVGLLAASAPAVGRDPIRLTHGPMLGQPSAHSVTVWGRTSDPGEFTVHYGLNPDHLDEVGAAATTHIGHDNTGVARLEKLQSDARYHYQIWVNGRPHGLPGSFHTLPSPEDTRNEKYNPKGLFNFRFEIGSCTTRIRCTAAATAN